MKCASCQHENPAGARFCNACAAPLAPRCPSCGADNPPGSRFCNACAAPLAAGPAPEGAGARKVVTIVFADLVGSTAMHERLDAESVRRFMDRYYAAMRTAVETHGGRVTQLLGDGVMAVFGAPHVAEDDAIRAVRAALAMQQGFRALVEAERGAVGTTGLRVAVNTGEIVANQGAEIIGDPVNVAARLQEEGRDGDVVIGAATHRLVAELVTLAPLGSVALKGRAERVAAYRVVSLERPAGVAATAFVGREDELRRLTAVYDAAVAAPAGRLAVILGSPGLGKSRLISELERRLGDRATVLTARCGPSGATFAPLAETFRTFLNLDDAAASDATRAAIQAIVGGEDAERARIANGVAALLAGTPVSSEETFFAVRRFLTALTATRPVVLALDDLQWAEPLLLDLTEHLVQWSTGVPLLVVAAARPELRETRAALAAPGGLVDDVVTLGGLDAGAAMRLAANVIGADELPAVVAGRVLATSEGNPLFVSELVRMLVHDGALKREGERWTTGAELAQLEMPPTIHALLAARLERLPAEERLVLERASVVGRQFSRAAVAHLLPREVANLPAKLEALRRSELIEPDTGWFLGEPVLRFHHVLIRDAAYRRLLKETRAELHGRFADWLEARVGEAVEHDETIGWHLEQAHQHLGELGPLDDVGRALGERAARYLGAAGRRALARDDVPLAASLLGRANARLEPDDPAHADLALDWCEALLAAGDVGSATGAIDELGRLADPTGRLRAWHTCFAGQLAVLTDPQALHATTEAVAAAAETLAAAGDAAGEAKAHQVHATALARLGRVGACEAALDRALAAARQAHDRRRANAVLAGAPLAALWGPSPVTRASGRCLDVVRVLRITHGAPAVEAVALRCQAVLEALRGRSEAARRMIASSRRMVEELGITHRLLEADVFAGLIELLEGNPEAAERCLRPAYEGLREHGLAIDAAQAAALLGRALLALGRAADAEAISRESEALAGDDLQAAIAWRGVRAEALARRGEHAAAVDFARAAVEIAAATDALLVHADARVALATALRAAGRGAEGHAEEMRAIELWEAKGATLLAERARREVGRVAPAERPPADRIPAHPVRRRLRPNAATANAHSFEAALAAGDADAFASLLSDDAVSFDHPNGAELDRPALISTWRGYVDVEGLTFAYESLATLGDSLALCRQSALGSGVAGRTFDVGPYEIEKIVLIEVDPQGRRRRVEFFAPDHLGSAIARLYARYAELLPEGPARERATAIARLAAEGPLQGEIRAADFERYFALMAPDVEFYDGRLGGIGRMRGAHAYADWVRSLLDLADDVVACAVDVLALTPETILLRWVSSGRLRAGGGTFERLQLMLASFGDEGRVTYLEQFDAENEDTALARFDELSGTMPPARQAPAPSRPPGRRVQPNLAIANLQRATAAIAGRDLDAFARLLGDHLETVHHLTGTTYDRDASVAALAFVLAGKDVRFSSEPLATLGPTLALARVGFSLTSLSLAGASVGTIESEIGPVEHEVLSVIEVEPDGRQSCVENFAANRLGDALVRLYERYADHLPEGPARARAAATARSVAALLGPKDAREERLRGPGRSLFAPDVQARDHRTVGFGSLRGADATLQAIRTLRQLSYDIDERIDDVLDLRSDGLLARWTTSGTIRASGGAFAQDLCTLFVFGPDGLVTCWEQFDADRDAEALARFDELAVERPAARPVCRRVRANAATAHLARLDAAVMARNTDALPDLFADGDELVDHTAGVTYGLEGVLSSLRLLFRARDISYRHEPLATLGDALVLARQSWSFAEVDDAVFGRVGASEHEDVVLSELDASGRRRRADVFAPDHLGDAVACLYQRYAELLPEGAERTRAAATARSVAALAGLDLDRWATALAPAVEFVDRRTLGLGIARGAEAVLRAVRSPLEATQDLASRWDDILELRSDVLFLRRMSLGTDRTSGGSFERRFLLLLVFGPDGLVTRWEQFDADRDAEALARFDQLTGEPGPGGVRTVAARSVERRVPRVRPNAATAHMARVLAAYAARDPAAFDLLLEDSVEVVDRTTGATYDRQGLLASLRALLAASNPSLRYELLATLGDSLSLSRAFTSGSRFAGAKFDVGAYEREELILTEVGADGRRRRSEVFATDHLRDAIVRLYERHADLLADGPARVRAAATARTVAASIGPVDLERMATIYAPDVELVDHRVLGTWSARGAEAARHNLHSLVELSGDIGSRVDAILDVRPDALLLRETHSGTLANGGGTCEWENYFLQVFTADGLTARMELFDADREAEALARFDELTAEPDTARGAATRQRRVRPNAATAHAARLDAAIAARDADALPALTADELEVVDHPVGTTYGREGSLHTWRSFMRAELTTYRHEALATLGDVLALCRNFFWGSGAAGWKFDVGAYELERLELIQVDPRGRRVRSEIFGVEHLDAAIARLYERYAELLPAGPARTRAAATARSIATWLLARQDLAALGTIFASDVESMDHRAVIGLPPARGAEELRRRLHSWHAVGDSVQSSIDDVVALRPDALLVRWYERGHDQAGGNYENIMLTLGLFDGEGLLARVEMFDADRESEALARFDELTAARQTPRIENAATRTQVYALLRSLEARDWGRVEALFAPDLVIEDHRRLGHETLHGPAAYIESFQALVELAPDVRQRLDHLDVSGRAALAGMTLLGTREGGAFEMTGWVVGETDAQARVRRLDRYDFDQLAEAKARFASLGAAAPRDPLAALIRPNAATAAMDRLQAALAARDWSAVRDVYPADATNEDRRRHALTSWTRDQFVEVMRDQPDGIRPERQLLSTAGDRVHVERVLWIGGPPGGPFEIEHLWVVEVDAAGRIAGIVSFDVDDRRAALREAWTRWLPTDSAAAAARQWLLAGVEAWNDHDRARMRASLADDVVVDDHRLAGMGRLEGAEAYVETLAALWNLAPDIEVEVRAILADERHGMVSVWRIFGTFPDGGPFENQLALLHIFGSDRPSHLGIFDIENVDAALARLAELRPDPLRIPPNAATRASDRFAAALAARDMNELTALCAPTMVFDDRRRGVLLTGDRDMFIASIRIVSRSGRQARTTLATAGDCLTLERILWRGGPAGEDWEAEFLCLREVDTDGRLIACILFDLDDRRAASQELSERYVRSDAGRWLAENEHGFRQAWKDRDLARMRAALPDDFVFHDHRRTGLGLVEGAYNYIPSVAAIFEQAPDAMIEVLYDLAVGPHGHLSVGRMFGTLATGGPFENVYVALSRYRDGRFVGLELFEVEDLELARARFEELRPDPLRIPPNAACRIRDRLMQARYAHDWPGLRALVGEGFVYEDRRKHMLLSGDVEFYLQNLEYLGSASVRHARQLIATIGDRIALEHCMATAEPGRNIGIVEVESLMLTEIDASARLVASITFDPDDRRAAFVDARARFAAGEAAAVGGQAPIVAFGRAFTAHDWDALRACIALDAGIRDNRSLGVFSVDRDQWVDSVDHWVDTLRMWGDLVPDVRAEPFHILAWNGHGQVVVTRLVGTMRDGGPVEYLFVTVFVTEGDRIRHLDVFDIGDVERALARFAELSTARETAERERGTATGRP